ncbi:hypothetical protein BH10BAC2_BH10BAC2_48980 [soil metagenome]
MEGCGFCRREIIFLDPAEVLLFGFGCVTHLYFPGKCSGKNLELGVEKGDFVKYIALNLISMFRTFSILAYFLIFLQGSMILLPFGLMLVAGAFTGEPLMKILIALADIALIMLPILSFKERTKWTIFIEIISFFALLLPLLKIFLSFSFEWFNYFAFLFPTACFIIFFPLSIVIAEQKFRKGRKSFS